MPPAVQLLVEVTSTWTNTFCNQNCYGNLLTTCLSGCHVISDQPKASSNIHSWGLLYQPIGSSGWAIQTQAQAEGAPNTKPESHAHHMGPTCLLWPPRSYKHQRRASKPNRVVRVQTVCIRPRVSPPSGHSMREEGLPNLISYLLGMESLY